MQRVNGRLALISKIVGIEGKCRTYNLFFSLEINMEVLPSMVSEGRDQSCADQVIEFYEAVSLKANVVLSSGLVHLSSQEVVGIVVRDLWLNDVSIHICIKAIVIKKHGVHHV